MEESSKPGENIPIHPHERDRQIKATIQAFASRALIQKFADMPGWLDFDLTVSQVRAIYFLFGYDQLTISELARLLGTGKPAASILVQQLVERQLVQRSEDPQDRRRSWVRLTERGGELVNGRREAREATFSGWLDELNDDEIACLLQGVTALLKVVRRSQSAPAP